MSVVNFTKWIAEATGVSGSRPTVANSERRAAPKETCLQPTDESIRSANIMIVDDEPVNTKVLRKYLQDVGYKNFTVLTDPRAVFSSIKIDRPDVILLDIMMPGITGIQILEMVRNDAQVCHIPVIIVTAATDATTKAQALNLGATDFLSKPVEASEVAARVRNTLLSKANRDQLALYSISLENDVQMRTSELERSRQDVIHCLARAAECRDDATGFHIIRVGKCAAAIARQMGWKALAVVAMEQAAKLHDVGKIGIPDSILLKPGKLTTEEYELMKKHCEIGRNIIRPTPNGRPMTTVEPAAEPDGRSVMDLAAEIAYSHHEKWDGSGYPQGLKGTQIPISGRIVAIVDVFDALRSDRPYKRAFPFDECLSMIDKGRGSHFDPKVVAAFYTCLSEIIRIRVECGGG